MHAESPTRSQPLPPPPLPRPPASGASITPATARCRPSMNMLMKAATGLTPPIRFATFFNTKMFFHTRSSGRVPEPLKSDFQAFFGVLFKGKLRGYDEEN